MMKKKSQQTLKHKPPNIINLVTKVFLALLMIVTTTFTGITGSSGIDLAKPASASEIITYNLSLVPGNEWDYNINCSQCKNWEQDYARGRMSTGSMKVTIDYSSNKVSVDSFSVSGKIDYSWTKYNPSTYNYETVASTGRSISSSELTPSYWDTSANTLPVDYNSKWTWSKTISLDQMNQLKYSIGKDKVGNNINIYNQSTYPVAGLDYPLNLTSYLTFKIDSYSAGGGSTGGSCGSTSTSSDSVTYSLSLIPGNEWDQTIVCTQCRSWDSTFLRGKATSGSMKINIDYSTNKISVTSFAFTGTVDYLQQKYNPSTYYYENIEAYGKTITQNDLTPTYWDTTSNALPVDYNSKWIWSKTLTLDQMNNLKYYIGKDKVGSTFWTYTQSNYNIPGLDYPMNVTTSFNFKVDSYSSGTTSTGGTCGGTTSPPPTNTTKTVYPKTCATGLTPKGTPGTSSFYCEKPVKQTEIKNPDFIKDINLGDIIAGMGDYGSTGDRGDGQFNLDSGNHNNGWYLNGNGDAYKSDHVQFTNVPDNGYVNALGDSWSPEYLITQGKNKIDVPAPTDATTVEKQKRDTSFNNFKSTGSLSEVIAYNVTDLEALKAIQSTDKGLIDLFSKTGSNYKYGTQMVSHKVDQTGEGNYDVFRINNSGYYILGTKYIDMVAAKKESASPSQDVINKFTYYSFIPVSVNFMVDLGYLPIYNNLLTQINDNLLTIGNKKANHKLANLEYQNYKSMKVPSAYNYTNDKTLIGSTSGGLQLLSKDLSPINVTDHSSTMDSAKITDIVEYDEGFYVATDKGILYLNCNDNTLNSTSINEAVNDLEIHYDTLYSLTDGKLSVLFADGANLIKSSNEYDLSTMFENPATKAGRVELLNGLLTVSSKDDSSLSEVITLTK